MDPENGSFEKVVMYKLGEISAHTKAIQEHLATLNSKVATQEARIQDLQNVNTEKIGATRVINVLWATAGSVGMLILNRIFK